MLEIPPTHIVRKNHCYQITSGLPISLSTLTSWFKLQGFKRNKRFTLYTFLWNGKGDEIKRKVMINDYGVGGLKMIDISSFNKSLKTTWIKKIFR